jgi:hemin uptake protein HemP
MTDEAAPVESASSHAPGAVRITMSQLFQGQRYVVIMHSGQECRLQITKAGKLTLTK